jgi:hypothetical protein
MSGALPLDRLSGADAQPLGRMALAWLPVGVVAGLALRAAGMRSRLARGAVVLCVGTVVLLVTGAVSDAVSTSTTPGSHVSSQLARPGIWAATALLVIGSLLVGGRPQGRPGEEPATGSRDRPAPSAR